MTVTTLQINPIVTSSHYQYYFNLTERTARRRFQIDKIYLQTCLNKRLFTFLDFYNLYGAFPCPKFKPKFINYDMPEHLTKVA